MKRIVFGECVQGASHKRADVECQDSYKKIEFDDGTVIMAVADGHGSKSSPYSKTGSTVAVNVFCKVMRNFYNSYADDTEKLLTYLNREGEIKVAQTIDSEWKHRILKVHADRKRKVPLDKDGEKDKSEIYKLYGSTLVGLMITPIFFFAFQIGDGDITYVDDSGVDQVLQSDKILGTETHSLCKVNSWKNAISVVRRRNNDETLPALFMLSTDGFSNSYKTEQEFIKTCTEYYEMIKEHGANVIDANLKPWLSETSEMGCGDDITVLMAFYTRKELITNPSADASDEGGNVDE